MLAQTLDFAGITPNPARDRVQVRLPREAAADMEPPTADHVEAVCWLLTPDYMLGALILDATGVRVGEFESATVGDLDESRKAWLIRASVSKTRRARWVELPDDLYRAVVGRLPAREDRDPAAPLFGVTADRLRTAIGRACRDAGVPLFSPHALRHRRISLLHRQGESWATDRREDGAEVEDRHGRHVHPCARRRSGGRSCEIAHACQRCTRGADPRADPGGRTSRICRLVQGQAGP